MSSDLDAILRHLSKIATAQSCKALVQDVDEKWRAGEITLTEKDWPILSKAIGKWKGSVMREPVPSRIWCVTLKNGKSMTMVVGDENPITQDDALFFARQRFFDAVLTVE